MSDNTSILKKYQRQPKLYIDLPSQGKYYSEGSLTKHEEIEVYSMTASDEIIIKTPDALLNGEATARIIANCVPSIKDPWQIPITDIYTILSAIRLASYGDSYELAGNCPKCKETNNYGISLQNAIEYFRNIKYVDFIKEDDFEFYFRPQTYREFTNTNREMFKLQRQLTQHVNAIDDPEKKDQEMQKLFDALSKIRVETVLKTVEKICIDGEEESRWAEIVEFISTSDKKYYNAIEKITVSNNNNFAIPPAKVNCVSCNEQYELPVELDHSNFFANSL